MKPVRHRRILDLAAERPEASTAELAAEVPSATADLVERVLDEHGDPATGTHAAAETDPTTGVDPGTTAESDTEANPDTEGVMPSTNGTTDADTGTDDGDTGSDSEDTGTDGEATGTEDEDTGEADGPPTDAPAPERFSERQRSVLAAIAADPAATQQELADQFDVTRATISRWVNDIDGFEWSERASFVDDVFEDPPAATVASDDESDTGTDELTAEANPDGQQPTGPGTDAQERIAEVEATLDRLEERVGQLETAGAGESSSDSVLADPELVHKVVHACMASDEISNEEELRILKALLE